MTGSEGAFRLTTFALLAAGLTMSVWFRSRADRRGGPLPADAGRRTVLLLRLYGLAVLLPLLGYLVEPGWFEWARVPLPDWLRWTGGLVTAGSLAVLHRVLAHLGLNVSPTEAPRAGATLVTSGPYRIVRHPLYTFGALAVAGLALLAGMWWLAAGLATGLVALARRTRREEARLIEVFGDDYRSYMRRTGRFLPRRRRSSPGAAGRLE